MTQLSAPAAVSQNIARAKSLARRDEAVRALDSLIEALQLFEPTKIVGKARYEVEVNILECIGDLNRTPKVKTLLLELTKSPAAAIAYAPGSEKKLLTVLSVLRKGLFETEEAKVRSARDKLEGRKNMLLEKGTEFLKAGETARGKAVLRQLGDEFGKEPGVLTNIGSLLLEANLQYEAAEFWEQALELFPKESKIYAGLVNCYVTLHEYEKAEQVYIKAIKQFSQHPRTLLNLAKLYLAWNKKDKAFELANRVYKRDAANQEAKDIMDKSS